MPLIPSLFCLFAAQLQVDGLEPGERARVLPRAAASELEVTAVSGRVIDAFTGWPVPGASVETWTKEICQVGRGLRRVGEARSDRGGQFRVRVRDGALAAGKMRVRAPGYLTCPGTVDDLEEVLLFPAQAHAPRLRVVDLSGAPIAGARITTTHSCAHDVPAFEVWTDAFGEAELPEYGLQDRIGELRVRAAGYEAVEYLDADRVLRPPHEAPAVLVLPRRPILSARFLDRGGDPLANCPLWVQDGDGEYVRFTDAEGRVRLAERYDGAELVVYSLAGPGHDLLYSGSLPEDGEVSVRAWGGWDADEVDTGRLRFVVASLPEESRPELELFHEDGWTTSVGARRVDAVESPAGKLTIRYGRRFLGWAPRAVEIELSAGEERTVELAPVREPVLEVRTPPGEVLEILVEGAGDSTRRFAADDGITPFPVPAGTPLTVLAWGARSRRGTLAGITADAVLDLTGDEARVEGFGGGPAEDLAERPRAASDVRVRAADGAPLPAELFVEELGTEAVEEVGTGAFRIEAAAGFPVLVRASAEGYADTGAHALAGQPEAVVLELLALAAVEIEAPFPFDVAPPFEDGLDALHPGAIEITLVRSDGRRIALSLVLEPGERRRLAIRE